MQSHILLNNGVAMPRIGYGTYKVTGAEIGQVVPWAVEAGIRLIDTASIYKVL